MRAHEFVTEKYDPLDQDIIDLVKISWDEGKSVKDIAASLGLSVSTVDNCLNKYYRDRPKRRNPIDPNIIDLIKSKWDEDKTPTEIAADVGLPISHVAKILANYYPSRTGKRLKVAMALTDDDKATMVSRFVNGETTTNIAKDYGLYAETVADILKNKLGMDKYNDI